MATDTSSAATLAVSNPSNGDVITTLPTDSVDSALAKLAAAKQLFDSPDQWLPLATRLAHLEKAIESMQSQKAELAAGIAAEGGKPLQDAQVEVERAIISVKTAIHHAGQEQGKVVPMGHHAYAAQRMAVTQKFPIGVVLAFSAFNHPLNLIVHQVVPAYVAGCPCIIKPAPDTPLSCLKMVEILHNAGVPNNYLDAVIASDLEVAKSLVGDERIGFFSFIGSPKVGWMLRSQLQPGVRCALEHGGAAPCIVTNKAKLDNAITSIIKGGFYHAGQVCVSTQRVFVEQDIYQNFVQQLIPQVEKLNTGSAEDISTDVGPLIRPAEVTRVHQWVNEAVADGAKLLCGGEPIGEHYYAPTVLESPDINSKVSQQEIFGPVLCLYPYQELDAAIAQANQLPFAFQASIFSQDIDETMHAYRGLQASAVMVNDHTAFREDGMPFAGLKQSGLGIGGIPYSIEDMQIEKLLVVKSNEIS